MPLGEDLETSLAESEARFPDMRPGHQKEIIWAYKSKKKTRYAVVFVHGFSASKGELRPVPDALAKSLKANLFFTRLPGHGRSGPAMHGNQLSDWYDCMVEALEIGARIGEETIIVSSSTGGTLTVAELGRRRDLSKIAALVFFSPNFGVRDQRAKIGLLPAASWLVDKLFPGDLSFEPRNDAHAAWWTHTYPFSSAVVMIRLVRDALRVDLSKIKVPALFVYSDADAVVRSETTADIVKKWPVHVTRFDPPLEGHVDPFAHVIAGDIVSPDNTEWAHRAVLNWLKAQLS